ncbi:MAG: hypothetical protein PHP98_00565 [Kiritimatiellae bacterium]|nr:hypothetical protein [Kiritimatiellia bacterium]
MATLIDKSREYDINLIMKEWMFSLIAPGLGQMAQGSAGYGMLYLICVPALYWLNRPFGLAAHAWCVIDSRGIRAVRPRFGLH